MKAAVHTGPKYDRIDLFAIGIRQFQHPFPSFHDLWPAGIRVATDEQSLEMHRLSRPVDAAVGEQEQAPVASFVFLPVIDPGSVIGPFRVIPGVGENTVAPPFHFEPTATPGMHIWRRHEEMTVQVGPDGVFKPEQGPSFTISILCLPDAHFRVMQRGTAFPVEYKVVVAAVDPGDACDMESGGSHRLTSGLEGGIGRCEDEVSSGRQCSDADLHSMGAEIIEGWQDLRFAADGGERCQAFPVIIARQAGQHICQAVGQGDDAVVDRLQVAIGNPASEVVPGDVHQFDLQVEFRFAQGFEQDGGIQRAFAAGVARDDAVAFCLDVAQGLSVWSASSH